MIFGRTLRLLPYFMCANREGSGETARMCTIISWAGSNYVTGDTFWHHLPWQTSWWSIRIFNGNEVQIKNSVTSVTLWHHKACRVMPNSYPQWRTFQFATDNHYGFFFLHTLPSTIAFRLEYVIFSIIHWNNYIFWWRHARFGSYPRRWRQNIWWKIDVNMMWRCQKWRQNFKIVILTSYHCVRRHFLAPVVFTEIPVGYARISGLHFTIKNILIVFFRISNYNNKDKFINHIHQCFYHLQNSIKHFFSYVNNQQLNIRE